MTESVVRAVDKKAERWRWLLYVALALAGAMLTFVGARAQQNAAEDTAFRKLIDGYCEAWSTGTADAPAKFYAQDEGFGVSQRPTNNPPFVGFGGYAVVSDQLNISSTIPFSQSLPARPAPPDPATYKFDPKATVQIRSWPLRYTIPYVEQWNINIQKALPGKVVIDLGYVGNHSVKMRDNGSSTGGSLVRINQTPAGVPRD